jgi:predicted transposase/invertase (TIGR01784 family)
MTEHDGSYKHIFSHPEVVTDLLRGFVHEDWVEQIDYATLEKVNGSYIADDLRGREDDIIWRVRHQNGWLYIYLLIEFQSRVDPHMALRVMVYTGLLYQDLTKSEAIKTGQKLPPVFPIVIYNGEGKWTAARDIAELIEPMPGSLAAYRPAQKHFVLDEGRITESELPQDNNALADIIRLESSPEPQALRTIVSKLAQRMKDPKYDSLRRALVIWINRVIIKRLVPGEHTPEVTDLQEIDNMLAERVVQWTEKWKQEGLVEGLQQGKQQGRQEGRQEGRQQGEMALLVRQLTLRFGPLNAETHHRIETATLEQLEQWAENILDAATLEDVFKSH